VAAVAGVRGRGVAGLGERGPQDLLEHVPGDGAVGWDDRAGAVGVVAVEADDGVVVDDAAGLEFVDLDVAAAQVDAEASAEPGEVAPSLGIQPDRECFVAGFVNAFMMSGPVMHVWARNQPHVS
jgi:hypothetical protein